MKLTVLDDDLTTRVYDIDKLEYTEEELIYVDSSNKEKSALQILSAFISDKKQVLYDEHNEKIKKLLKKIDCKNIDFSMLLFTSGTTGNPVGAFKSRENLLSEVDELADLVKKYNSKKVLATVPFIHIYGILTAILLPYKLDINLFFKKHFLPHDLLENIEPNSLVVTTPLYIKSLIRLGEVKDLSDVVFISSTGPLDINDAKAFIEKFNTNLIQLFGSTETGGISYKEQIDEYWKPANSVKVSTNEDGLLKISSPFVSRLLYENGFKYTDGVIQSFDYVEFDGDRFKIIGRNSQIFKVAGKRYSTINVEEVLESLEKVKKAYVRVVSDKHELKDEVLEVYLESEEDIELKEISKILKQKIGNIKFPIKFKVVEKIPTTPVGKKMLPI